MKEEQDASVTIEHHFVDEAGDPTIFRHRGAQIVGQSGCSVFFMLGLLIPKEPQKLARSLSQLRDELLADPYFTNVPSFQISRRKTAFAFHAKDDLPEVRREVFRLLVQQDLRFFAVIRDKRTIADLVKRHRDEVPGYRYHPNQLYYRAVSQLFYDRLSGSAAYRIVFAQRGKKDRNASLRNAIEGTRESSRHTTALAAAAPIEVTASHPKNDVCLQACDYCLWALQRLYEKEDARYWDYIAPIVEEVLDYDDQSMSPDGTRYHKAGNVLTIERVRSRPKG